MRLRRLGLRSAGRTSLILFAVAVAVAVEPVRLPAQGPGRYVRASEQALIDQVHLLGAFMDTLSVLYPQVQDVDPRAMFEQPQDVVTFMTDTVLATTDEARR